MAGGDAQHLASRDNPGTPDSSPLHGPGEVQPGLAHVPQAGKSRVQQEPRLVYRAHELVSKEGASGEGAGVLRAAEVGMDVDKARQDRAALNSKFLRPGAGRTPGFRSGVGDLFPLQEHRALLQSAFRYCINNTALQKKLFQSCSPHVNGRRPDTVRR